MSIALNGLSDASSKWGVDCEHFFMYLKCFVRFLRGFGNVKNGVFDLLLSRAF